MRSGGGDAPEREIPAASTPSRSLVWMIARSIPPGRYQNVVRDLARQGYRPNKSDSAALVLCNANLLKRIGTGVVAGE